MTHAPDYKKWDKFDSENDKAEANAKKDQFEANEDPMKSKVNGTPFNVLMQQAVKMKTAQTAPDRNKFDSWPRFYQNSVFAKEEIIKARTMEYGQRMAVAQEMKNKGNDSLNCGDAMDANHCYEQALAVFKWAENTDPDWKKKGIKDADLSESSYEMDTIFSEKQVSEIESLLLSCYLNLAICCHRMSDFSVAIQACDAALVIYPKSPKALYRRAMARIGPKSSGGLELDMAVADLKKAKSYGEDKMINKKLNELLQYKKHQKVNDKKTFTGMFNRGEIYKGERGDDNRGASGGNGRGVVETMPDDPIEKQINDAEQLVRIYERNEEFDRAEDLKKKIEETKKQVEDTKIKAAKQAQQSIKKMDFSNPTPDMIEDAKKRGIDLTDERVVQMLTNMQEEKYEGREEHEKKSRGKLMGLVSELTKDQLLLALKSMNEGSEDNLKKQSVDTLKSSLVEALMAGKEFPSELMTAANGQGYIQFLLNFLANNSFKVAVLFGIGSFLINFLRFYMRGPTQGDRIQMGRDESHFVDTDEF